MTLLTRPIPRLVLLLLLPFVFSACSVEDDRPAVWSFIQPAIIQPSCATARCHSKFTATQGLRFDSIDDSYTYLVDGEFVDRMGNAEGSRLIWLLEGREVRLRMPPEAPLPDKDIDLIYRWILDGVPR